MTSEPVSGSDIAPPAARYAHGVLTTDATRWLHTSGVVPVRPDGTVPVAVPDQVATVWANLGAILRSAGMDAGDVVSVTTYVTGALSATDLSTVMAARDTALAGRRVASTLVTVAGLARPEWLLEIALVAAR